jgi:uncharacterized protein YuzE
LSAEAMPDTLERGRYLMKLRIDAAHDIGYLSLVDGDETAAKVAQTMTVEMPPNIRAPEIVLDFDADGYLIGIEFLRPSLQLRPSVVERAMS